ncbi:MAG: hypothetical protein HPY53_01095 [Brevinematales bacterium]|nr:hypothetical protein [Brevinematales bacterium]
MPNNDAGDLKRKVSHHVLFTKEEDLNLKMVRVNLAKKNYVFSSMSNMLRFLILRGIDFMDKDMDIQKEEDKRLVDYKTLLMSVESMKDSIIDLTEKFKKLNIGVQDVLSTRK